MILVLQNYVTRGNTCREQEKNLVSLTVLYYGSVLRIRTRKQNNMGRRRSRRTCVRERMIVKLICLCVFMYACAYY